MEYKEGYVAFIDVLGFSSYVLDKNNASNTWDLFDFVKKFCYLFNTSSNLKVEASFFSDSIVLSTNELEELIMPIYLAESYINKNLGLLFRGGVCYGKYYHKDDITFGPAVIEAYKLEGKASYSRIILDKSIRVSELDESIMFYPDIDGEICLNLLCCIIESPDEYNPKGTTFTDQDVNDTIYKNFANYRETLLKQIKHYKQTSVIDKYLWRVRPFNYTCNLLANLPCGEMLFNSIGFSVNEQLKKMLRSQIITEEEILRC